MRRYLLTLLSSVIVLGAHLLYGQLVSLLITRAPVAKYVAPSPQFEDEKPAGPRASHEVATRYLPQQRWLLDARVKIQADNLHLFFDERAQENSNTEIRVSPVAIIWIPPEKEGEEEAREPLTILAESATFRFDEPVELSDIRTHMIRQIMLRGQVQIKGQNDLEILGSNFTFSRDSQHLFSDHPLQFRMQQHRGYARNIQLNLEMMDGGVYSNNPRIVGIEELVIRDHLELHLLPEDAQPVLITSEDRFQYHFKQQQAMLMGEVFIHRSDAEGMVDDLSCDRLILQLEKVDKKLDQLDVASLTGNTPVAGVSQAMPTGMGELTVRSLLAEGGLVKLRSQAHELVVEAGQLSYDLKQRVVRGIHQSGVKIRYRGADLVSPDLHIKLDEENQPELVRCSGPGQLQYLSAMPLSKSKQQAASAARVQPEKPVIMAQAHWHESLVMEPDPQSKTNGRMVTLTGPASLSSPAHQAGLMAKSIRFWISGQPQAGQKTDGSSNSAALEQAQTINPASASGASSREGTARDKLGKGQVPEGMKIERALASGEVAITSGQLDGEYESLELIFVEDQTGLLEKLARQKLGTTKSSERDNGILQTKGEVNRHDANAPRMQVDARELKLNVLHNEKFDEWHLSHVESIGEMQLTGQLPGQKDGIEVNGQKAEIFNEGGSDQSFRLLGSGDRLAWVRSGLLRIDGIDLLVDRGANMARVHGGGSLQIPVNTDMEGVPLKQAELLKVSWREKMKFNGQQAHFIGHVRAQMGDSVITCEELVVSLSEPVSLQSPDKEQKPRLVQIECRDRVRFEMNHYEESRLTGVRYLNVSSFKVNHETGRIDAQGPGAMEVWQRRTGSSPLGLPESGMTKEPKKNEKASDGWDYTRLTFAGNLVGNIHQHAATLNDRINVLHGPVERPLVSFERDDRPKNSVWMRCETLEILMKKLPPKSGANSTLQAKAAQPKTNGLADGDWSLELKATKNAEIEGDRFLARADLISYDHQSSLFVMRALENRHVTLWYYEHPLAPRSQYDVKMVRVSPNGNLLELDRTLGASGTR